MVMPRFHHVINKNGSCMMPSQQCANSTLFWYSMTSCQLWVSKVDLILLHITITYSCQIHLESALHYQATDDVDIHILANGSYSNTVSTQELGADKMVISRQVNLDSTITSIEWQRNEKKQCCFSSVHCRSGHDKTCKLWSRWKDRPKVLIKKYKCHLFLGMLFQNQSPQS